MSHCFLRLFRPLPIIIKFVLESLLLHLWHLLAIADHALTLPGSGAALAPGGDRLVQQRAAELERGRRGRDQRLLRSGGAALPRR